ncbi:hypothetical protein A5782_12595 [Mycobacterium sp. 852002-40037_SCH5390672]|nr:hypothetical protein A5782_12595 [Mycobacterium sp. 852002-40037_SCH5390672]
MGSDSETWEPVARDRGLRDAPDRSKCTLNESNQQVTGVKGPENTSGLVRSTSPTVMYVNF